MSVIQWLAWQISGLGPMMGQASHFLRCAPERYEYSVARYTKECRRLANVLEYRLRQSEYLGAGYSIADIAIWPLVSVWELLGINRSEFSAVDQWYQVIKERPAIGRVFSNVKSQI